MLGYLGLPEEAAALTEELLGKAAAPHTLLPAGHPILEPTPLIAEISAQREAELRETYRGSQADRAAAGGTANAAGETTVLTCCVHSHWTFMKIRLALYSIAHPYLPSHGAGCLGWALSHVTNRRG